VHKGGVFPGAWVYLFNVSRYYRRDRIVVDEQKWCVLAHMGEGGGGNQVLPLIEQGKTEGMALFFVAVPTVVAGRAFVAGKQNRGLVRVGPGNAVHERHLEGAEFIQHPVGNVLSSANDVHLGVFGIQNSPPGGLGQPVPLSE